MSNRPRKISRPTEEGRLRPATSTTGRWTLLCACLLSALIVFAPGADAETSVRAEVDRREIALDETVTLSLIADSMTFSGKPDTSPLEKDFRILNSQESSRTNIVNGEVDSSRRWDYTLAPKHEGELTIPAIRMGKQQTRPLTVTVSEAPEREARGSDSFFVESDVTPRTTYKQAELSYTVRIYTRVNFLKASLEPPDIDDAIIEAHEDRKFRTEIDGRYYRVIERNYSIFPQTSGTLNIPPATFQGRVEGYRSSMLDPGKLVVKRTRGHRVEVKPPAEDFEGPLWLPARDLTVTERWSGDPDDLKVGDSITRTVVIKAEGLQGLQLPPLPDASPSNARVYSDQPKFEDRKRDDRIVGVRTDSFAIIPTESGEITLPEIRIPWWNTRTERQEVAVVPPARLTVKGGSATTAGRSPAPDSSELPRHQPVPVPQDAGVDSTGNPGLWVLLSLNALLFATSIAFAVAWYRSRRSPPSRSPETGTGATSETRRFEALSEACRHGDRNEIRRRLLAWGQAFLGGTPPAGLDQLAAAFPELRDSLAALDAELFRPESEARCDIEKLLSGIRQLRQRRTARGRQSDDEALAPLYPL